MLYITSGVLGFWVTIGNYEIYMKNRVTKLKNHLFWKIMCLSEVLLVAKIFKDIGLLSKKYSFKQNRRLLLVNQETKRETNHASLLTIVGAQSISSEELTALAFAEVLRSFYKV